MNCRGFNIEPFCYDVCGDHRRPQTLAEICRNMDSCCGFRAVAAREKYPGLTLLAPDERYYTLATAASRSERQDHTPMAQFWKKYLWMEWKNNWENLDSSRTYLNLNRNKFVLYWSDIVAQCAWRSRACDLGDLGGNDLKCSYRPVQIQFSIVRISYDWSSEYLKKWIFYFKRVTNKDI